MRKWVLLLYIFILAIISTGCWDMVEINQWLFPYSIGVDINHKEGDKYLITISYPNINAIGKNATQKERVHVVSTIASSVFEGSKELSNRLPYPFYFKHLRVLVLGKEVAKDEKAVREVLDGLIRDFIINKKVRLVLAEDKAQDILLGVPKASRQEVIEGTLFSMLREDRTTTRYTSQTLTEFVRKMDITGVSLMPRIVSREDDIKVFGGAIFKNYALVGYIGELENRALALMRGIANRAQIDSVYNGTTLTYSMTGCISKNKLIKEDGNIKFKIDIETEGTLQEYIIQDKKPTDGTVELIEMEKAIEDTLKSNIDETLELLQKKYKADAIGIGEYIMKFHPKVWKEIQKDWDDIFPELDIEVVVDAKIRRRGLTK